MWGSSVVKYKPKTLESVPKDLMGVAEIIHDMSYENLRVFASEIFEVVRLDPDLQNHSLKDMNRKDWIEVMHAWASTRISPTEV